MPKVSGYFLYGLTFLDDGTGTVSVHDQATQERVPDEFVIIRMKAFLKSKEREFFRKNRY